MRITLFPCDVKSQAVLSYSISSVTVDLGSGDVVCN